MKVKTLPILFLLLIAACGDDGLGKTHTFTFAVSDGEGLGGLVADANIEIYSSIQVWFDGGTPIKTYTTKTKESLKHLIPIWALSLSMLKKEVSTTGRSASVRG